MATITYLEEENATMADVAERYGFTAGWLSRWLARFEQLSDELHDEIVCDKLQDGRPADLSEEESDQFVEVIHEPPE